jgi:8-oxo-dGTP pyrophosphatase MutT (NUDIX family)
MYYKLLYLGFKVYCFLFRPVRMGVRVLMVQDGRVWLVRHTYMEDWFMPGGGVERRETLEQAARREACEEVGADLGEVAFVGIYSGFTEWKTDHTAVFLCADFTLTGKSDGEIAEVRAFPLSALPATVYGTHRRFLDAYHSGQALPLHGGW